MLNLKKEKEKGKPNTWVQFCSKWWSWQSLRPRHLVRHVVLVLFLDYKMPDDAIWTCSVFLFKCRRGTKLKQMELVLVTSSQIHEGIFTSTQGPQEQLFNTSQLKKKNFFFQENFFKYIFFNSFITGHSANILINVSTLLTLIFAFGNQVAWKTQLPQNVPRKCWLQKCYQGE